MMRLLAISERLAAFSNVALALGMLGLFATTAFLIWENRKSKIENRKCP